MCGYMDGYLPFLYIVSQKMISHFYVLGFGMEHWVLCNTYGTCAITLKWDMGILLTKVTHGICDPKELRATTSCGNVLCLGSGLSNTRLFVGRPRHQRRSQNWQVPEVDFLSNRHPAKSASEKPWSAQEEDAEYQRPKSGVWRKYLNMRLTTCWCKVLGDAWKQAHRHTENRMSGLVAVK
jgi:hypothetical protein